MNIQFGYCSGVSSSKIQSASKSALRVYAQSEDSPALPARLEADQFQALNTRLSNMETTLNRIAGQFGPL